MNPGLVTNVEFFPGAGDAPPVDLLFTQAYGELRRMARMRLRSARRDTLLNTTALVHESYMRLAEACELRLEDRAHFLAYAGRAMRSVIVDLIRKRMAARHGGDFSHVTLTPELADGLGYGEHEILRVHDALQDLAKFDSRMVRIVEMRYFAGMTESEIGEALAITERTVRREWEKARLWLSDALCS